MPKAVINAGDFTGTNAAEGFSEYDGPTPPKGSYKCKVSRWWLKDNSKGDKMFKIVLVIAEPKSSEKARYNGYAIWHNANLTNVGAPFANAMLDAMGLSRAAVWKGEDGGVIVSKKDDEVVGRIGGRNIADLPVTVIGTRKRRYGTEVEDDEWDLQARTFAPASKSPVGDDDVMDEPVADDDEPVADDSDSDDPDEF